MMPSPTNPTDSLAMAATSRCLDPQTLTGAQATRRIRLELLAVEQVAAALGGLAAGGARRRVAATREEVSTLPATTAAGLRALSRLPSGAATVTGRIAPAAGGMSGSVSTRTANQHADRVTASGQLRLPSCWSAEPLKSRVSSSP